VTYRILTEASGSLTAGYLINAIHEAGHLCVGSDIDARCFARPLLDDFALMPRASDPALWPQVERILAEKQIDIVIPSLDETLIGWAERKSQLRERLGVHVVLSAPDTVRVCQDKWLTYEFFRDNRIPTPLTSLRQDYALVKPRLGRGASGVRVTNERVDMNGMISQELVAGVEYTVDVFCDRDSRPVYIVPRRRINVRDGKSTAGVTEEQAAVIEWVRTICARLPFVGPVNIQCFVRPDQTVCVIEINPRIAGGMALGIAATENWIKLIATNLLDGQPIVPRPIRFGLEMKRYYAEVFVPAG
jgi:carbamoyl-phosphate synthase large subunit